MEAEKIDIPVRLTLADSGSEITRLHLDPGDTLIVSLKERITAEQSRLLAGQVKEHFPDNEVVVLHGGMTLSVAKASAAKTA